MKLLALIIALLLTGCNGSKHHNSESFVATDWQAIKALAKPVAHLTDEYGTPRLQPLSTLAWEDGLSISRDGLHLYAFYLPADLLSFVAYFNRIKACPEVQPFLRGPLLELDIKTNPWNCAEIIHSNIAYATRQSTNEEFGDWQRAAISTPANWEGAPKVVTRKDGSIDLFVFTRTVKDRETEIFWMRDVDHDPPDRAVPMPEPVNSEKFEDTPHIERIDEKNLVLLFDNHAGSAEGETDIFYSYSRDDGASWDRPLPLNSLNSDEDDLHPHLWNDGKDWWLYFVSTNDVGTLSIFRAKQTRKNDFNSWGEREPVISPGGSVLAVGEPTLTAAGDISFVAVYLAENSNNPNDRFEIDPWYLPRIQ